MAELARACAQERVPEPALVLEPGRSLTARAGVTFYTVGSVKVSADNTAYVAVDGGMSDNPRPALYDARYTALLAERADEPPSRSFTIVGKHCESGDLLICAVELPEPRRGDILAVPGTGAYTLAMSSTYNAVPRPAAVLVGERRGDGDPPARDDRGPARARDPRRSAPDEHRRPRRVPLVVRAPRGLGMPSDHGQESPRGRHLGHRGRRDQAAARPALRPRGRRALPSRPGAALDAIDAALRQDAIQEVVVVTRRSDEESWREAGEVEAARDRLGVPVSHLLVA